MKNTKKQHKLAEKIEHWPVEKLKPYERNARTHSQEQIEKVANSIVEFGFTNPILVASDYTILAGHCRLKAAQHLGITTVPVVVISHLNEDQRRAYILADNKLALDAGWDDSLLAEELRELEAIGFDVKLTGFTDKELDDILNADSSDDEGGGASNKESVSSGGKVGSLNEKFVVPPFTVLDARQGYWQDRKRAWLATGIESALGRDANLTYANSKDKDFTGQYIAECGGSVSVFDPVLCEIVCRWFSPAGGQVLDPFAGGSVRGIVANRCGRQYLGIDLSPAQVKANQAQAERLCADPLPVWHCGDSRNISKIAKGVEADLIFSCPPYADLEVYSDNPADLSTMEYGDFLAAYISIIKQSAELLKPNRFAVFVVGDVRDKSGIYQNFVSHTIEAFIDAGLCLYNEAVFLTPAGSLPLRVVKQFTGSRKLGKQHQNVLVFVKGEPKKATAACGEVEVPAADHEKPAENSV